MLQLGIVTFNIANDWDLPTILSRLEKLGYAGVELRTTHAHKVEANLTREERQAVRKRFEDSPVDLAGLGSAFEFQAADPAVVRKNIEGTMEYVRLAHDIGAPGVKVRPNGIPRGRPRRDLPPDRPAPARDRRGCHRVRHRDPRRGPRRHHQEAETSARIMNTPTIPTSMRAGTRTRPMSSTAPSPTSPLGPEIHEVHIHDLSDEKYPGASSSRCSTTRIRRLYPAEIPRAPTRTRAEVFPGILAGLSARQGRLRPPVGSRHDRPPPNLYRISRAHVSAFMDGGSRCRKLLVQQRSAPGNRSCPRSAPSDRARGGG